MANLNKSANYYKSPLSVSANSLKNEIEQLKSLIKQQRKSDRISIATSKGYELILYSEIVKLEALDGYVNITLNSGKQLTTCKRLKYFTEKLDTSIFLRVHRSFMVNLNFVTKYFHFGSMTLTNEEQVPVSRTYRKNVVDVLGVL